MRRITAIGLTILLFASVLTVGLGSAASATQYQETTTGISMGPVAESNINNFDTIQSTLEGFGVEPPSEITMVATPDGKRHIVFSSEPIPAGEATIDGRTFPTGEVEGQIIVADDFEVETTGDRVAIDDLENNPAEYDHNVVRLDASAAVVSTALKPTSGVASQQSYAHLFDQGAQSSGLFQQPPGELASTLAITESNASAERSNEFDPNIPEDSLRAQSFSQQFWGEGAATVDAAVVPVYGQGTDSSVTGRQLILVDVNYKSQTLDSPAEIRDGSHEGEVVTVESDLAGTSTSTQEYLTSVASCGDKTVSVPMSPPVCVPVTNDIIVHSGVLADGTSAGEMPVYYAGVSNAIQTTPTETETGRYQLTGEVVSTSEIDSSLEGGYALQVYDRERVGDANIASSIEAKADQLEERIKSQLELDESEWGSASSSDGGSDESSSDGGDSTDQQSNGGDESTASASVESGDEGGGGSDGQLESDSESAEENLIATVVSSAGSDIGVILGIVSMAVFALGVVLDVARSVKSRYGDNKPKLTEQMTTMIVFCASVGLVVSGLLMEIGWGAPLLLFGGLGIIGFAGDYLVQSALVPLVKQNLNYEGQQSKAIQIVGGIVFSMGGLVLITFLVSVLMPDSSLPIVLQVTLAIMSAIVSLFGSVVGALRFFKKHLSDDTLNTAGNLGLVIVFAGSIGIVTAGVLAEEVLGGGTILIGGGVFGLCALVAVCKSIYEMV